MNIFNNHAKYVYDIHGSGPPLVMLHGFTGSRGTWDPLIEKLSNTFQLIVIDMPGHGGSEMNELLTITHFCEDLNAFLDHLELPTVHLLGYSMGGRAALSFAVTYPEKIRSLILESASPGLKTEEERANRRQADERLAEQIGTEGLESFVNYWQDIPLFDSQKSLPKTVQKMIRKERLSHTKEGLAASLLRMGTGAQPSWWNDLNKLNCPVLLMAGEWDEKFVRINERMHDLFIRSQFEVVPKTGHAIHVEQPGIFGKIVEEFILNQDKQHRS